MTADDDSCSSYDSISATDLTVGPAITGTDTDMSMGVTTGTDASADEC